MPLSKVELVQTANGSFLALASDTAIPSALREYGGFELHLCEIAVALAQRRGNGPGTLVDIGANIGTFCVPVARETGCRIVAFEAQRVIAQLLGATFLVNGIDRGWVHNVVLAAPGHSPFTSIPVVDYAQPGNFGAFSVKPELFAQQSVSRMRTTCESEPVETCTLDDFGLNDVFLVKIDVEGYELDVLLGSVATLERNGFPPLLFESWRDDWWQEKRRELLAFVASLGYTVTEIDENFLAQHRSCADPLQPEFVPRLALHTSS